jgi:hypothetical protein
MSNAAVFSAIVYNDKIDAASGVIYGVSVITMGEAQGKNAGTWIDKTTLSQIHSVASKFKDGVKVKMSMSREHDGSVGQIVGVLKNFRTEGDRERADFHLLKSDENFAKIIEMSSTMPSEFGFSVVIPKELEEKDDKQFLRCSDIYSIDLVEAPAANPNGLFSAQPSTTMSIKYAKGNEGEHAKDCECKECMSKQSKKGMSQLLAETLGLAADAPDETIITKLAEALKPKVAAPAPEIAALSAKLTEHETQLAAYRQESETAKLTAKKAEIAGLVADASREGKVVPLTDDELAKMDVAVIKSMFSKLPPGQVKTPASRKVAPPVASDGKAITFDTADKRVEFCLTKQAEGAAQLTAAFLADPSLHLTRN